MVRGGPVLVWVSVCVLLVLNLDIVTTVPNERQAQELMLLDALGRRAGVGSTTEFGQLIDMLGRMIPQSCRYRGVRYECGLSISCVMGGGKPMDLCSGGMIWACCVDRDLQQQQPTPTHHSDVGVLNNASKFNIHE
ncbi:hypothetical protein HHI36_000913 [Cryptolaemus montrouzieri]|uniref:Uncharacterized protein n=1 Tax=Cryptolaemus montrouzieri TaxID=559131 RepID=A0ABD2P6E4_9CUCU